MVSHDNSRKKLSQKIQQLLAKSDGDKSWVFVDLHENIILQDKNSDGKALENITVNACEVVQKYLHWKMDETACFFCTVSFILFRSIWLQQPVGHILKFVSAARLGNYLHQAQAVAAIMKEVESIGKSGQYDFDALKIALKKKVIILKEMKDSNQSNMCAMTVENKKAHKVPKKRATRKKQSSIKAQLAAKIRKLHQDDHELDI